MQQKEGFETISQQNMTDKPRIQSAVSADTSIEGHLTVDVFENEDNIVVQSTIAGVNSNDVDVSITKDTVTIKGHRYPTDNISPSDYYHRELYWGPFSRSIILPVDIDSESAKASMKNGILTIHLPKLK